MRIDGTKFEDIVDAPPLPHENNEEEGVRYDVVAPNLQIIKIDAEEGVDNGADNIIELPMSNPVKSDTDDKINAPLSDVD